MKKLNQIFNELGIPKVRIAKYFGVSRQMIYNYLDNEDINSWPKDKKIKLFQLFNIKSPEEINQIKVDADFIMAVEGRLNEGVKMTSKLDKDVDLKDMEKSDQELLSDIFYILKEKLMEDKGDTMKNICRYLCHLLQSIDTVKELKYILAYVSKSTGFVDPHEFVFDENEQLVFESILFSAMTLYNNGGASPSKLADSHRRFVMEIEHRKEEKLSRTQELNTAKVQALKELGYTEINENNAAEVLAKIAEIQSRKIT